MKSRRYRAIEVVQQPSAPPMYLTTVSATELLEWCDIPRTKEDYMAGYQRLLSDSRTADIKTYLETSSQNVLPGAVIVATDQEYVSVVREGEDVFLEITPDTRTKKEKLDELFGSFSTRLSPEELASADVDFSTPGEEEEEYEVAEHPVSYLAKLTQELRVALQDPDSLNPKRRAAIDSYIEGVSKPGLIIDGQHRVIGAKNVSHHDVMLPIVVLQGLPHAEQVFQFYVLNNKAKPLRPTDLRRIISTSLANSEIDDLYMRFKTAGVDATEAQWTYEMNNSAKSVFKNLIDFGLGTPGEIIPENVADQLVRSFMKMPRNRYASLMDAVSSRWEDPEQRLQVFFDFWRSVSEVYQDAWAEAVIAAQSGEQHRDCNVSCVNGA